MNKSNRRKLQVCRGDTVEVVAGNARGARGRILRAMPQEGRVVVEGVNMVWKHLRRSRERGEGGRIQIEAPLDASNVMLICTNRDCEKHDRAVRTRTGRNKDGKKTRICVRCGHEIPKVE